LEFIMKISKFIKKPLPGAAASKYAIGIGAVGLAGMALAGWRQGANAERTHPARGRFLDVDGVRLRYVERGQGEPLVLIHGNGTQIEDFETSGLVDLAAKTYRVILFDRPGFGYSSRPRSTIWTASAQADLLQKALAQMGIDRFVILGHSLGAAVAAAMALRHAPSIKGLVLASGYYYSTDRFDSALQVAQASPIVGDLLRYTVAPLLGRLGWAGLLKKIFGPAAAPESFSLAIKEMALRPSQLHASAADATLMIPAAMQAQGRYGELSMPVSIVVGEEDRLINASSQSIRLHSAIPGSHLRVIPGVGHMVHHSALAEVMNAVDRVAQ
jgi:pimeloyl-ACP methyl ester carboxylesterase